MSKNYRPAPDRRLPDGIGRAKEDVSPTPRPAPRLPGPEPESPKSPVEFLFRTRELIVGPGEDALERDLRKGGKTLRGKPIGSTNLRLLRYAAGDVDGEQLLETVVSGQDKGQPLFLNHVMVPAPHPEPEAGGAPVPAPPPTLTPTLAEGPGSGITVAVLDTGIDPDFPLGSKCLEQDHERRPKSGPLRWQAGHGTFVAGLIRQLAPGARIVPVKVFGNSPFLDDATLADELEQLESEDVDVLNLSFGGPTADGQLPAFATALANLRKQNPQMAVVASAGNECVDMTWTPAGLDGVIAVAALNQDGTAGACFTNFGPWVDVCTQGEGLRSAFFKFRGKLTRPAALATKCFPEQNDAFYAKEHDFSGGASFADTPHGGATWSGTSFAAARVSGHIAATAKPGKAFERGEELRRGERFVDDTDGETRDLGVPVADLNG